MKKIQITLAALATTTGLFLTAQFGVAGVLVFSIASCLLNRPRARLCTVTLSFPEIMAEILSAFRSETPELFGPDGFSQDFKSDTAVLGDTVIAKISHLPVTGAYDPNNGGWENGVQDVTTLIEDVPVTLNQLRAVTVRIPYLTGLATKGVDLFKAAVANIGFALGKYVVDSVLTAATTNVSNSISMPPAFANLDTFDGALRNQCNAQRMMPTRRFCFLNTPLASALGADDRTKSALFYNQLNGEEGFRRWKNVAGLNWIREYGDFPKGGGNLGGLAGDPRLVAVSVRKIQNMTDAAKELNIPRVMDFYSLRDEESGLELCGIAWQKQGTGDVLLSAALLFGTGVGNQGGAAGTMTDNAGCLIRTS